ncbi:MAG: AraC family transcriptional regulator [Sphingomonadales bacterium]|nr:MAG: AraC family transcriptional regulator [Sphingomonadales bacterium]
MADVVTIALGAAALAQGALTITLLATRPAPYAAHLPLGAFLAANAVTDALGLLISLEPAFSGDLTAMQLPFVFLLGPTFWFYVVALTSEARRPWRWRDAWHLAPLLVCILFLFAYFALPTPTRLALNSGALTPRSGPILAVVILFVVVQIVWIVQAGGYLAAVLRRLVAYRRRLKDLFATTERRELWWISVLALLLGVYWLWDSAAQLASMFMDVVLLDDRADSTMAVLLVWFVSVWGLRQIPGFTASPIVEPASAPSDSRSNSGESKYERSALSREQAQRIADKIAVAMEEHHLYRNPNLSLRDLSEYIGAMANYVSQTLNETIGQSFFDYIGNCRVREAQHLLSTTADSVESIAFSVGFNSRSAFYKAFQRNTGMTPSAYRQSVNTTAAPQQTLN